MLLIWCSQADLASYLVSVNANLEAKDGQGNTVFHLLVNKPHMETLKVLEG